MVTNLQAGPLLEWKNKLLFVVSARNSRVIVAAWDHERLLFRTLRFDFPHMFP